MSQTAFTKTRVRKRIAPHSSHESAEKHFFSLLALDVSDSAGLIAKIRRGLRFRSYERFLGTTELPTDIAPHILQIPMRTLARRKKEGRLRPDESDRLVRLARLYVKTLELFGNRADAARHWLMSPAQAIGGATPLEYATTEIGAREVEHLIGRLEHGIPS